MLNQMAFETKMNPWGQLISLRETAFMFNLYNKTHSFGRGPTADSRFTSKHFDQKLLSCISNLHFRLKQNSNEITLENLSTNGTYINGELVAKNEIRSLHNYDEISLSLPNRKAFIFHHCLHKNSENYPDGIVDKYYISKNIGNGASGQVRLAFLKNTLEKCAVKILQKKNSLSSNKESSYMLQIDNEIKILQTINHVFIISLKECIYTEACIYIVMELAEEGDLLEHIKEQKRLPESEVKLYFYQLALAVQHLHENGITHRDIKLENIILSRRDNIPVIKLSDLGLSAVGISELQGKCGSISYMAPEMLSTTRSYTNKVDMWSLGVVLFTCLSGFLPFCSNDTRSLETTIIKCQYKMDHTLWKGVSTHAKNLIKKLLVKDPEKRYGISETLNHQWLKDKEVISSVQSLLRKGEKISQKRMNEFPEENDENVIFMNKKEDKGATKISLDKKIQNVKAVEKNNELLLNHENTQDALKELQIFSAKSKIKSKRGRKKNTS